MRNSLSYALARLVRIDSSLLAALVVLTPLLAAGTPPTEALSAAVPIVFMSMGCFILNDISDVEKDRCNHRNRPLPSGRVTRQVATVLYFLCLALALMAIYLLVEPRRVFAYVVLLVMLINYDHVVSDFPAFKNAYVAVTCIVPVSVAISYLETELHVGPVLTSVGLGMFGRELLKDIPDLAGDGRTLAKILGEKNACRLGFLFLASSLIPLGLYATNFLQAGAVALALSTLLLALNRWALAKHRLAILWGLKIQAYMGLVFLV